MYLKHVSKRLINAYLIKYKNNFFDNYAGEENENKNKQLNFQEIVKNFMSQAMMHDISHTVLIADDSSKIKSSIVPPFFNYDSDSLGLVNSDLMKEELYAGIWQNTGMSTKPNSTYLLSKELLDNNFLSIKELLDTAFSELDQLEKEKIKKLIYESFKSKENYINAYFEIVILLVKNQNIHDLKNLAHTNFIKDYKASLFEDDEKAWGQYDNCMETESSKLSSALNMLRTDKDKKVLEMLTYIWENKDNSRVLVDLFFKETSEYFKKLEFRYIKK